MSDWILAPLCVGLVAVSVIAAGVSGYLTREGGMLREARLWYFGATLSGCAAVILSRFCHQ